MLDRKRPAFRPSPAGSAVVCRKASSTDALLSASSATLSEPKNQGSTLAEMVSSDSPREKPCTPGPISAPVRKPLKR